MGTVYRFDPDEEGRFIAEVDNPKHIAVFLAVTDHYRDADAPEPAEPEELEDEGAGGMSGEPAAAEGEPIPPSEITGIGPAMESRLAVAGITDARQIAALTPEEAQTLDEELGLGGRIARDEWVEQAKALAQRP
jgi:predicted flap endonuclease-1-like 5' DNA nuclease